MDHCYSKGECQALGDSSNLGVPSVRKRGEGPGAEVLGTGTQGSGLFGLSVVCSFGCIVELLKVVLLLFVYFC